MKALVCIDTQTLVYAIQQEGDPELRERARWLFQDLDEQGVGVMLPALVLAEYLIKVPAAARPDVVHRLSTRFDFIAPFDARCVVLAAELEEGGRDLRRVGEPGSRRALRADAVIVATAKTHGAAAFHSHDTAARELARRAGLPAYDLPAQPPTLFTSGTDFEY